MRVLLIEEDDRAAAGLRVALHRLGMVVDRISGGERQLLGRLIGVDLVLLDLGPRDVASADVCRAIRDVSDVPIIMLSARGQVSDRITGLYLGADDYLVKPYDLRELVARMKAVSRRRRWQAPSAQAGAEVIDLDGVLVDLARGEVLGDDGPVALTPKELRLLAVLVNAAGSVCSRTQLMLQVWGRQLPRASRSLDVHVATLRTKLGRPNLVRTVRGVGYCLAYQASRRLEKTPA